MAAITSAAAGAWSNTATWTGAVIPGNGDTITLTHQVTLDDARTIGTSPAAGNTVVTISSGGRLTIQNGGTLTCRGDVNLNSGGLRIEGGGTFQYDASASAAPTTTEYRIFYGTNNANSRLDIVGTSDTSRGVITSVKTASAANGYITGLTAGSAKMNFQWFRLENMGTTTTRDAISGGGTQLFEVVMRDGIVESTVARVNISQRGDDTSILQRVQWKSTSRVTWGSDTGTFGSWTRLVEDCSWPQGGEFVFNSRQSSVRNVSFPSNFSVSGQSTAAEWDRVFVPRSVGNSQPFLAPDVFAEGGALTNTYVLRTETTNDNPHWVTLTGVSGSTVVEAYARGWVFESLSTAATNEGDGFFTPTLATRRWTVEQCITLLTPGGTQVGNLVYHSGSGKASKIRARHNTIVSTGFAGLANVSEGAAVANETVEIKDNIIWRPSSGVGGVIWRNFGTNAVGIGAELGFNTLHNITSSASGAENPQLGYVGVNAGALVTGTLSALTTDDTNNPSFVDTTRNFTTWGRSLGYTGTDAAVQSSLLTAFSVMGNAADASYNANVTVENLLAYVRAGFSPTNIDLQSASDVSVGGWRGAVEGTIISSTKFLPHIYC